MKNTLVAQKAAQSLNVIAQKIGLESNKPVGLIKATKTL